VMHFLGEGGGFRHVACDSLIEWACGSQDRAGVTWFGSGERNRRR
jgi:hypothetical protein